jgi:glutamate carboxypeptidase
MPDPSIPAAAERIARHAERELEALVGISSPSGDVRGADEAVAVAAALLPDAAEVTRPECSTPGQAADLLARVTGTGRRRVVLLGHLDTVIPHDAHQPLRRDGPRLHGSGSVDMKGGVVLALGVLRELAAQPEAFAELALLLVVDEEWRTGPLRHAAGFAGWDACLCFEAGERTPDGDEGVVVKRKAAGTLRVQATGRAAHSGSAPDRGANALLALATAAQAVAARHDPRGPVRLTAVPTVVRAGEAFNIVPPSGELLCDLRADELPAFDEVIAAIPSDVDGVRLEAGLHRAWPGMDAREPTTALLAAATEHLGRRVVGTERGGASDASFVAPYVPLTVDGLGPRGGGAHTPDEHVLAESLRSRAEVALALTGAALAA